MFYRAVQLGIMQREPSLNKWLGCNLSHVITCNLVHSLSSGLWSCVALLVEHNTSNAKVVGSITAGTRKKAIYCHALGDEDDDELSFSYTVA